MSKIQSACAKGDLKRVQELLKSSCLIKNDLFHTIIQHRPLNDYNTIELINYLITCLRYIPIGANSVPFLIEYKNTTLTTLKGMVIYYDYDYD